MNRAGGVADHCMNGSAKAAEEYGWNMAEFLVHAETTQEGGLPWVKWGVSQMGGPLFWMI